MFLSVINFKISRSKSVKSKVASMTKIAISVLFKICLVFSIRNLPSSPISSRPAVSMIFTGPSGKSSMALCTGSVVVPLTGETTAIF